MKANKMELVIGAKEVQEPIGFRVPKPMLDKFKKICDRQGVTLSAGMRNLIEYAIRGEK